MTKQEMILEILAPIKWNERQKAEALKDAMKNKKERVEKVYNFFLEEGHAVFCIACLGA